MNHIHFICREGLNLRATRFPEFESGYWDIAEEDAAKLVGGMVYFHEAKNSPSYFGGRVSSFHVEHTDEAHAKRIVFNLTSEKQGKGAAWEGSDYSMAWNSGVIE
jgi:hypothetical protein